jgi:hypothetical protein
VFSFFAARRQILRRDLKFRKAPQDPADRHDIRQHAFEFFGASSKA